MILPAKLRFIHSSVTAFVVLAMLLCAWAAVKTGADSVSSGSDIFNRQKNNQWFKDGVKFVEDSLNLKQINKKAKNVIIFLGDGMGISTVTSARILEGQLRGEPGEENVLSWEKFPYSALSKTYNVDLQVSDSAGTATAIMTGVKSNAGVVSVDENAIYGDCTTFPNTSVLSILELAEINGLSTGVVTTARITHATPSCTYSHSPSRSFEYEAPEGCRDIASQLIDFPYGNGLEVALGGGRRNFFPNTSIDPETSSSGKNRSGYRTDRRNLADEWVNKTKVNDHWQYVWNEAGFNNLDINKVDHVLGLFQYSHMQYAASRKKDEAGEPSLTNMTAFAIKMLRKNPKGYFLLVEGARIDHGHHRGRAYDALHDTVEFASAVAKAVEMTKEDDTLLVVTADHSHVFTLGGYQTRGNPIFGLTNLKQPIANDGKRYTSLGYYTGPGAKINRGRVDPKYNDTDASDYKQQSLVPRSSETHGGEDVAIYARGPQSHLFHGVMEQNAIFHVMDFALCLSESKKSLCKRRRISRTKTSRADSGTVPPGSDIFNRQKDNQWFKDGLKFLQDSLNLKQNKKMAKNVIIFLGDGMGISTVTAARILEGQLRGESGEENVLSWEKFPYSALSKTYTVDQQVPDSAGTATAIMTGVKSNAGVVSVDENASKGNCTNFLDTRVLSILELAEIKGLSTGVVTTARITHATPSTAYSHSSSRSFEYKAPDGCRDIASQLIDFPYGNGLEVALGGGRRSFFPNTFIDPERSSSGRIQRGKRKDRRNLVDEWLKKSKVNDDWRYVWNETGFKNLDINKVDHVLGLFEYSHMHFAESRKEDEAGEPSLTDMTEFAIKMLSKNPKGYILLVEGGRIDHGHHGGRAYDALHDAVEFANAVAKADEMTQEDDTLLVVTADHSHVFTIGGYQTRGNPIFGLTNKWAVADDGKRYTTLGYYSGSGAKINRGRVDPKYDDTAASDYKQQSLVPTSSETHGGEDVGIYARGPQSHHFHGVMEQNAIFHVIDYALCLTESKKHLAKCQDFGWKQSPRGDS